MKFFFIRINEKNNIYILNDIINNINYRLENKELNFIYFKNSKNELINIIDFLIKAYNIKKNQIINTKEMKCQIKIEYEYNLIEIVKLIVDLLNCNSLYLKNLKINSKEQFNQIIVNNLEDMACIIKNNEVYYCDIINSSYFISNKLLDNDLIKSYKLYWELKN